METLGSNPGSTYSPSTTFFLWKCVAAINPNYSVTLGCGVDEPVSARNSSDLEVNVIVVQDQSGKKVLFVSVDTLYVGPTLQDRVREALRGKFEPDEILISASHTHNAPMIDETKPNLGSLNQKYRDELAETVISCVEEMMSANPIAVSAYKSRYKVDTAVYRRKTILYEVVSKKKISFLPTLLAPNKSKRVNPHSDTLEFVDRNGKTAALIWTFPCHPVSYPSDSELSANYVGTIRSRYRLELGGGREAPVIFLQGASGDLRPPATRMRSNDLSRKLFSPGLTQEFCSFSKIGYEDWTSKIKKELFEALDAGRQACHGPANEKSSGGGGEIRTGLVQAPLEKFFGGNVSGRYAEFHQVELAGLIYVGLSVEPTWRVRPWIIGRSLRAVLVGCVGDVSGYLPSPGQWVMGGYEQHRHLPFFGIHNKNGSIDGQLKLLIWIRSNAKKIRKKIN